MLSTGVPSVPGTCVGEGTPRPPSAPAQHTVSSPTGIALKASCLHGGLLWEEPGPILQKPPPLFLSESSAPSLWSHGAQRVVGPGVTSGQQLGPDAIPDPQPFPEQGGEEWSTVGGDLSWGGPWTPTHNGGGL